MSQADWIKLIIGAVLTTGMTLLGQFLIVRYQHKKNLERDRIQEQQARRRAQWDMTLPRLIDLKDTAGYLHEHLINLVVSILDSPEDTGWQAYIDELARRYQRLDVLLGQFAEDDTLTLAIRHLAQAAAVILAVDGKFVTEQERGEVLRTLSQGYREVVDGVNLLLDGERQVRLGGTHH